MSESTYWRLLSTRKLWQENIRALEQGKAREVELSGAELMRRTDTSPAAIAASAARCAARRAELRDTNYYQPVKEGSA